MNPHAIDSNQPPPQARTPSYYPPMHPAPLSPTEFHWMIAIQTFDGNAYLLFLPPRTGWDAGSQAMEQARKQLYDISSRWLHGQMAAMLCIKTTVGTAKVQHVMTDPVGSDMHFRINLKEYDLLNEVNPTQDLIFDHSAHLADTCYYFVNSASIHDCRGQRVIVLRRVLDKQKVARLIILLLLISPVVGIIVGSTSHGASLGVAVSVGILVLASILQGLAAWFER